MTSNNSQPSGTEPEKNSAVNVLLNPELLDTRKPWEFDVEKLVDAFLQILSQRGVIDLRLAGTAALSSAIIYRLKVETLFFFEKLRSQRRRVLADEPPQVLDYPFRYEIFSTSIEDLLTALQTILSDSRISKNREQRVTGISLEPEPLMDPDQFLINIRKLLDDFRSRLAAVLRGAGRILFRKLTEGMSKLETARCFILMLFVANEGLILINQAEESDDIEIVTARPPLRQPYHDEDTAKEDGGRFHGNS